MNQFKIKKKIFTSGQTLVEVSVALAIFAIILTGLVFTLTYSLNLNYASNNHTVATKLAEEAIEIVRGYKDNNPCKFFNTPEFSETDSPPGPPYPKAVGKFYYPEFDDTNDIWVFKISDNDNDKAKFGTGAPDFRRRIYIKRPDATDNFITEGGLNREKVRKVTVQVEWESKGIPGTGGPTGSDYTLLSFITYFVE